MLDTPAFVSRDAVPGRRSVQTANTKAVLRRDAARQVLSTGTTEWTIAHGCTNRRTCVHTHGGLDVQTVDVATIDFASPSARVIDLKSDSTLHDITAGVKPAGQARQGDQLER